MNELIERLRRILDSTPLPQAKHQALHDVILAMEERVETIRIFHHHPVPTMFGPGAVTVDRLLERA